MRKNPGKHSDICIFSGFWSIDYQAIDLCQLSLVPATKNRQRQKCCLFFCIFQKWSLIIPIYPRGLFLAG